MSRWQDEAACLDEDSTLFFPHDTATKKIAQAKAICAKCPVVVECLDYAMDNEEQLGIWGGHTPQERWALAIMRAHT